MEWLEFYKNRRVFITGHTGFKGSWLCRILALAGADVYGFSLPLPEEESLFSMCHAGESVQSYFGDIRDGEGLRDAFEAAQPEIVFHLAAQPLVLESYQNPAYTYETNVIGTVNLLECVRLSSVRPLSVLNVTTDKVYENREWEWGYRENEPLNGHDPYSNSKSCSELVTHSYRQSFFNSEEVPVSTARAGNVIGGGDFAKNRIIPDCVRAAVMGSPIAVRNPHSVRPYQHVLDPLFAYLMIAKAQHENPALAGSYNVGPSGEGCVNTGKLVELFCSNWPDATWQNCGEPNAPHEAAFLKLDISKIAAVFGWRPIWSLEKAVAKTVEWSLAFSRGEPLADVTDAQIIEFAKDASR